MSRLRYVVQAQPTPDPTPRWLIVDLQTQRLVDWRENREAANRRADQLNHATKQEARKCPAQN